MIGFGVPRAFIATFREHFSAFTRIFGLVMMADCASVVRRVMEVPIFVALALVEAFLNFSRTAADPVRDGIDVVSNMKDLSFLRV